MKLKNLFAFLFVLIAGVAQAQMLPSLPQDKDVRVGKLANGLTYYIRQNNWPEKRINFYIAQRVGSLQEEESQRGLAHFLEHMAFNGSEHFKPGELVEYTRSIGVEFGSDLNAYTAMDQTVYRVCNVPSDKAGALDSCIFILKDWSNGLLLLGEEIDKERGVIQTENELRSSAVMRMLERNLGNLYPNSKYAVRMPIGLMSVVGGCSYDELRNYYHKWYRPDNQALIIVGDVDVDQVEQKIKDLFSGIKVDKNAAQVVKEEVADNAEPIIIVDKDKEQKTGIIIMNFKHDLYPDSLKNNTMYLLYQYAQHGAGWMLNKRLEEKTLEADCPYIGASAGDDTFIFASTKGAFTVEIMPKEGQEVKAAEAVYREVIRVLRNGFTATEYARFKDDYMSSLDKVYANKNKRHNDTFGDIYKQNYLSKEPIYSLEDEYNLSKQIIPMIPVDIVNESMKEWVNDKLHNFVIFSMSNEKEGKVYPTKEDFINAVTAVNAETIAPYVDNVKSEPLMSKLPKKGKIKKVEENKALGYKTLTLSNGVKVILKKTDYKENEIAMQATSKGGASLYQDDILNAKLAGTITSVSGLGNFDTNELEKALAGKQANVSFNMGNFYENVYGSCLPKDVETMMQLTYLKFTNIKKDEKAYNSLMSMLETTLKNNSISPDNAFSDSLNVVLYDRNPLFKSMEVEDLAKLNQDKMLQMAKERLANAADYTFYFIGNYDEKTLLPLIEQYIASLPADKNQKDEWKKMTTYHQGKAVNSFTRKMETPKTACKMYWYNNTAPYTLENSIIAEATGQILTMVYLRDIREDAGAAYSCGAYAYASLGSDVPMTSLVAVCPFKTDKAELAMKLMRDGVQNMTTTIDEDMLKKVKEAMLNQVGISEKTNNYWLNVISDYELFGVDTHTQYRNIVNNLTSQQIKDFVKNVIIAGGNSIEVVMQPE